MNHGNDANNDVSNQNPETDKVDRYAVNIKKPEKSGSFCHIIIKFSAYFNMANSGEKREISVNQ